LPMYENIAMAVLRRFFGALGLSRGSEIEHADTMIRALNIRPANANVEAGAGSGGEQAKGGFAEGGLAGGPCCFFCLPAPRAVGRQSAEGCSGEVALDGRQCVSFRRADSRGRRRR